MDAAQISLSQLRQLATRMAAARLSEIQLQGSGWSVRMNFTTTAAAVTLPAASASTPLPASSVRELIPVSAPHPGRFVSRHPGHEEAFVRPGSQVRCGDLVGLIRAGNFYLPVRSQADGQVSEVVADGVPVEYGSPLVMLQPDTAGSVK